MMIDQLLSRGALLFTFVIAIICRQAYGEDPTRGVVFSNMCYRRNPVVTHITRSNKAWQEGRRDVLDWGCGGGALSLALVEQGANKVVAIDLNDKCVNAANQRLKSFPNAIAKRPQVGSKIVGLPGRIAYRNQFDLVISYMGALTDGTAGKKQQKIATRTAMDCAVRACRDDGYVIVAECATMVGLVESLMVSLFIILAPNLVKDLNWWQISLLSALTSLVSKDPFVPLAARNIARSIAMKKLRMSSLAWSFHYLYIFISSLRHLWKGASNRRAEMESAGLSDIKVTRRPCFRVAEVLEATDISKLCALIYNAMYYPGMVVIYQGRKQGKRT